MQAIYDTTTVVQKPNEKLGRSKAEVRAAAQRAADFARRFKRNHPRLIERLAKG